MLSEPKKGGPPVADFFYRPRAKARHEQAIVVGKQKRPLRGVQRSHRLAQPAALEGATVGRRDVRLDARTHRAARRPMRLRPRSSRRRARRCRSRRRVLAGRGAFGCCFQLLEKACEHKLPVPIDGV